MKITNVRAVQPRTPNDPQDWRGWLGQILVAVDTEDGLTGYGVGGGGAAGIHVIHTVLRALLLGQDASQVESLWRRMYGGTVAFGRKGLVIMAISGVDLALWDLRGKAQEKPVVETLGGTPGRPMPVYRTGSAQAAIEAVRERGYGAVKLSIGRLPGMEAIVEQVGGLREALGPDVQIMTDASMCWDVPFSLRAAAALADYGVVWLEEPLPPDDLEGYARLTRESPVPIAGGEHEYTAAAFEEHMERGLHAIFQPDVCWCGGLTQLVEIYKLAAQYGVRVCPHRGSEVWSLHAIGALDPNPLAESGRPWIDWVQGQPAVVDGTISVADAPGFGVSFDPGLWT